MYKENYKQYSDIFAHETFNLFSKLIAIGEGIIFISIWRGHRKVVCLIGTE